MRDYWRALADQRDLAPASIKKLHALISGALRRGAREHGLRFDFHQLVPPPGLTLEKRKYATDAELVAVFETAAAMGTVGRCCSASPAQPACVAASSSR